MHNEAITLTHIATEINFQMNYYETEEKGLKKYKQNSSNWKKIGTKMAIISQSL